MIRGTWLVVSEPLLVSRSSGYINISNNTPLYFGSQSSGTYIYQGTGGNLRVINSTGNIYISPITNNTSGPGQVILPTNDILVFNGSTQATPVVTGLPATETFGNIIFQNNVLADFLSRPQLHLNNHVQKWSLFDLSNSLPLSRVTVVCSSSLCLPNPVSPIIHSHNVHNVKLSYLPSLISFPRCH